MSLDYHFTVEQEVSSSTYAFFGFNGTAGVWRLAAIEEAGGWKDRTTVEDMDLAVRASLRGWKFVYISSIQVKSELPSTFKAFRYQQHRWSCRPANLFRKMAIEILTNKKVSLWKKVHVIYSFFLIRKVIAHIVTFVFYCVVLPATILVPEQVYVPKWGAVYIPAIITLLNSVGTPRSFHLLSFWILFENVMSFHRTMATFTGLFESKRVNEWVVTEKLGVGDSVKAFKRRPRFRIGEGDENRDMERFSAWEDLLTHEFLGNKDDVQHKLCLIWAQIKASLIAPVLQLAVIICLALSTLLFMEKLYMGAVIVLVKIFRRNPEKRYRFEPLNQDIELGSSVYPLVLVQIPMYNEREVYQLSIGAACALSWPSDRIIIQVLDDSTDPNIKALVVSECQRWAMKGVNVKYEIRENRNGYKSGSLKAGMKHSYVKQCNYVAIFDADFQPEPDFLLRTIPFLVHNPQIALVQARWTFVNADECMMTRLQEMSLNYHFTVEQEVSSSTYAFFGFNGTAGVWRLAAIEEAGGWKCRTTVEDMDLAVRASLRGWEFVYVGSVQVKSELPSTFKAFCNQQHRWSCGPASLFRKMAMEIMTNKKVSVWKKVHVIYSFFLLRKIIAHMVTFIFYCVILPATVFVPEVHIPKWGALYFPAIITLLNSVGTPRSFHLLSFWILFENVMSMLRTKATFIGLMDCKRVNEWVVTEKLGAGDAIRASKTPRFKIGEGLYPLELGIGSYLLFCSYYDAVFGNRHFWIYLFTQGITFFIVGIGYVGTFLTDS